MATVEQVTRSSDELEVTVLPGLGCRVHRLRAFGRDLVRTPSDPATHADDPFFWGAYVMAPWTNRASAEPMTVAGRRVDLAANFPDGTAIHGQVYAAPWRRTGDATFGVDHAADAAWPWDYTVTAELAVDGPRLRLRYRLENRSDATMPGGLGLHAWVRRPVALALRARAVDPANGRPDAAEVTATARWGLDDTAPPDGVDATWLDLEPTEIGLRWPAEGLGATLRAASSGTAVHAAVANPEEPEATAVEPVTHRPWGLDRLARGETGAMDVLAPGTSLALDLELAVHRAAP